MPLTDDEKLLEIYSSAPADWKTVETLEFIHSLFKQPNGAPDSVRLVNDNVDWDLPIEADAPLFAGEVKTFHRISIGVKPPAQEDGRVGEMTLTLGNIPFTVLPKLSLATQVKSPVAVIYREYILEYDKTDDSTVVHNTSGPSYKIEHLTVKRANFVNTTGEVTCAFADILNTTFPRMFMTQDEFPGLFS